MAQSPFPGMDPYLEAPGIWADVHSRLMNYIAEQLAPQLAPKYIAELDTQIVIDRIDDTDADEPVIATPDVAVTKPGGVTSGVLIAEAVAPAPLQLRIPLTVERRLLNIRIVQRERDRLV